MGGPKWYHKVAGHTDNKHVPVGDKVTVNGVTGEILRNIDDPDGSHSRMPSYSGESDMYFRLDSDGKTVIQGTLYIGHKKICDFDWGHEHKNTDGKKFPKGVVHVQFYEADSNGNRVRANNGDARYMNNGEMKKYGPIIRYFNPDAKFRP